MNAAPAESGFSHAHADVLGVKVSALNMSSAVDIADRWIATRRCGYICLTGVHGVMEAQSDPALRQILNRALINAPDGMPLSWVGHLQGHNQMDRVFGPDFMAAICRLSLQRNYRHYLYGGEPGVAATLKDTLLTKFPGLQIAGTYTPPFRALTDEEQVDLLADLQRAKPDIVWIGLSTPKQEHFMAAYVERFCVPLLVGVGAAFDYHTGRLRDCSPWIKRAGLQWMHRLAQDPKRLRKRYLRNNPAFIWRVVLQMLHRRRTSVQTKKDQREWQHQTKS